MRSRVEELDHARLQRILGAHDDQAIVLDQLLEDLRAVAQVIYGGADIGPNCLCDQCISIVSEVGREELLDRRAHPIDDRPQVARLIFCRCPQLFDGGQNRPALRVAKDDNQACAIPSGGEFDAADLRRSDDVACDANDEEVPQALIEHDLRWDARI